MDICGTERIHHIYPGACGIFHTNPSIVNLIIVPHAYLRENKDSVTAVTAADERDHVGHSKHACVPKIVHEESGAAPRGNIFSSVPG